MRTLWARAGLALGALIGRIAALFLGQLDAFDDRVGPWRVRVIRVRRLIPAWAGAQTLGGVILLRADQPWAWHRNHELVHVCQWARLGPLFPLVYLALALRYGYYMHPFEVEARGEKPPCEGGER